MFASATAYTVIELGRAQHGQPEAGAAAWHGQDEDDNGDSIALGHFIEHGRSSNIAWLRGYRDPARRRDGAAMLLRPLRQDTALPTLAPVDPRLEPDGAQGFAVAQLLPVAPGRLQACAHAADQWFARYSGRGMIEAGILSSVDDAEPGYLVWLGLLRDEDAVAALRPQCEACATGLAAHGLLDGPAELLVLAPAPRSRLRWGPRTFA